MSFLENIFKRPHQPQETPADEFISESQIQIGDKMYAKTETVTVVVGADEQERSQTKSHIEGEVVSFDREGEVSSLTLQTEAGLRTFIHQDGVWAEQDETTAVEAA